MDKKRFIAAARNSAWNKGEQKGIRLLKIRGSEELEHVDSNSAKQNLWLGNRIVGSQVACENRSQLPGRRTIWKVRKKER